MFFQKDEARVLCRRREMPSHSSHFSPALIRNQRDWIYSLGDPEQVNFKCLENNTWETSSLILRGNGALHISSVCHIFGREFHLYPAQQSHTSMAVPHHTNIVLQHIDPLTSEEVQTLHHSTNTDVTQLDHLASEAENRLHRDINMMIHSHEDRIREQNIRHTAWYIAIPSIFIILSTVIICYGKPKLYI
ncbi:hypothetical protein L798_14478 [Zootermopsis nevadensis]|uniref:Uncharacterized protein n=1 Tax=Zootermopsis nevadensis TaxID=136037 RepID=A0A067QQR5_ZOONE|nr:hypothetical protein L798_14478 [Zootermopsis nevadensis]